MYQMMIKKNLTDAFPNVEEMVRTYSTLMINNCSGERSFSC